MVAGYRTMVILDSAHDAAHVAAQIEAYAPMVPSGCYLIVQEASSTARPGT
jgi:cephalosporin hydroxylase